MDLRRRVLNLLARRIEPLPLRLMFWDGDIFDFSPEPSVTITLTTPRCGRLMLKGDLNKLSDAYVSGEVLVDGAVWDVLACGIALADVIGRIPVLSRLAMLRTSIPGRHSRKKDAANVRFHYDVSNEFYGLWLDRSMVYSCAYFKNGRESLDQAQQQKLDHICRKLSLKQGESFLDVGCGWGSLVIWAVRKYNVEAFGATISTAQCDHARIRVAREGIGGQAEIRVQDYRDIRGESRFDKIASVGMYEHVGLQNLQVYFDRLAGLLKPGGMLLNHGIYLPNTDGRARGPRADFIDRYVFPGGELPTLPAVIQHMTKSGLEIADFEDLRPHYVRTLSLWLSRLEARQKEAIEFAGDERYRIWRMFLGGMAFAFDAGWLSVGQILAYKPGAKDESWRPWTREHHYTSASPLLSRRLDWREVEDFDTADA